MVRRSLRNIQEEVKEEIEPSIDHVGTARG